jgi:hypothetical protein
MKPKLVHVDAARPKARRHFVAEKRKLVRPHARRDAQE